MDHIPVSRLLGVGRKPDTTRNQIKIKSKQGYHPQGALDQVDQGLDNFYEYDQLTAMKWSLAAWKEVSTQTISNCLKHTGLFEESIPNHTLHTLEADEQSIESGLHEAFTRLTVRNAMSITNFLNPIEED
ncbi:hypothetical protein K3495_g3191 [Podosphaera aphanis]|nr:hypothetical protein K3495_g3191 [Podosphaera aphanis]